MKKTKMSMNIMKKKMSTETAIFCGRRGLALKGTNDSGPIKANDEEPNTNDRDFTDFEVEMW